MMNKEPEEKKEKEEVFIGESDPIGREIKHDEDCEKNEELFYPRFRSARRINHESDGA